MLLILNGRRRERRDVGEAARLGGAQDHNNERLIKTGVYRHHQVATGCVGKAGLTGEEARQVSNQLIGVNGEVTDVAARGNG